jgi:hypothetical protein
VTFDNKFFGGLSYSWTKNGQVSKFKTLRENPDRRLKIHLRVNLSKGLCGCACQPQQAVLLENFGHAFLKDLQMITQTVLLGQFLQPPWRLVKILE